jgi:small subunit ribosomal protein S2
MSIDSDFFEGQIDEADLLIPLDDYLTSGVHIGTTVATKSMQPFIYRVRNDGLYVLDIKKTDDRIRLAAKMLASYDPDEVAVISARQYGTVPASKLARLCNFKAIPGRFVPGTFTNPRSKHFIEPKVIFINDPRSDKQALLEAIEMNIPVIALCDSDNNTSYVDMVIPVNNKGRRSLARIYLLLTQQILKERGDLAENEDLGLNLDDFAFKIIRN